MARANVSLNPLVLMADMLSKCAESILSAKCEMEEQLRSFIWDDATGLSFKTRFEEDFKPLTYKLIPAINAYILYISGLTGHVFEYSEFSVAFGLVAKPMKRPLMQLSQDGVNFIKKKETIGGRAALKAYKCEAGIWTIGWGHTRDVKDGMEINQDKAEELFAEDVKSSVDTINNLGINLRQNQFDALVSFVFNVGTSNFNNSTLKKKILAKADDADITKEFLKWNKVKGEDDKYKESSGLTKRRNEEADLWNKKDGDKWKTFSFPNNK